MGDAGYRGISAAQDGRFGNKERKMIRQLEASKSFPATFNQKVDLRKVQLQVIKPWIESRVQELLGFEDDVVTEYVVGQLESDEMSPYPDPRQMQVSLTGFLESSTSTFMSELWSLLLSAQDSVGGIPREFVEKKKEEMRLARERDQAAIRGSGMRMGNRFEAGPGPSRSTNRSQPATFRDKQGNHTSRVQDAGWGSRARPIDDDRYSYQRRPAEDARRNPQRALETDRYAERQRAQQQRTRSPSYSRSASRSESLPSPRPARRRPRSPSYSRSPSRSRSRSPSPIRRHRRSPSNNRSPSPSRHRSPRQRRRRSPSYSRSRSRSVSRESSRSLSRSASPIQPRKQRGSMRSRSPPRRRRRSTTPV